MYIHRYICLWRFPENGVAQNGWFIRDTPIKIDDLRVPPFRETSTCIQTYA